MNVQIYRRQNIYFTDLHIPCKSCSKTADSAFKIFNVFVGIFLDKVRPPGGLRRLKEICAWFKSLEFTSMTNFKKAIQKKSLRIKILDGVLWPILYLQRQEWICYNLICSSVIAHFLWFACDTFTWNQFCSVFVNQNVPTMFDRKGVSFCIPLFLSILVLIKDYKLSHRIMTLSLVFGYLCLTFRLSFDGGASRITTLTL